MDEIEVNKLWQSNTGGEQVRVVAVSDDGERVDFNAVGMGASTGLQSLTAAEFVEAYTLIPGQIHD